MKVFPDHAELNRLLLINGKITKIYIFSAQYTAMARYGQMIKAGALVLAANGMLHGQVRGENREGGPVNPDAIAIAEFVAANPDDVAPSFVQDISNQPRSVMRDRYLQDPGAKFPMMVYSKRIDVNGIPLLVVYEDADGEGEPGNKNCDFAAGRNDELTIYRFAGKKSALFYLLHNDSDLDGNTDGLYLSGMTGGERARHDSDYRGMLRQIIGSLPRTANK
jgi:hypothetical protein